MKSGKFVFMTLFALLTLIIGTVALADDEVTKANYVSQTVNVVGATPITPMVPTCSTISTSPALAIPDDGYDGTLGSMACETLDLSASSPWPVDGVELTLGIDHTWIGDLTVKVVGPDSSVVTLQQQAGVTTPDDGSSCCGDSSNLSASSPITYSDASGNDAELMGGGIGDDGIVCQDDGICDYAPNYDQATPDMGLASFNGLSGNGSWMVCVGDSAGQDTGTIQTVELNVSCTTPTDVALTGFDGETSPGLLPLIGLLAVLVTGMGFFVWRDNRSEA